jgi:hypothetical protein
MSIEPPERGLLYWGVAYHCRAPRSSQNQPLESGQLLKPPLRVKLIDCIETANNPTETVVIRLRLSVSGISDEYRRLCAGDDPMESSSTDFSTILNRILDTADNLRIAKILVQMGLDPSNITDDALFNRLVEIVLANITLANMFALVGAIFFVATLLM